MRSSIDAGRTDCPAAATAAEPSTTNANPEPNLNTTLLRAPRYGEASPNPGEGGTEHLEPRSVNVLVLLFPGHFHREKVGEHLARGCVLWILLRAADVKLQLLCRRVDLPGDALFA